MMKLSTLIVLLTLLIQPLKSQTPNLNELIPGVDYQAGRVIFKLLPEYRDLVGSDDRQAQSCVLKDVELQRLCATYGPYTVRLLFPHHKGRKSGRVDLSLIGELIFSETTDVSRLWGELMASRRFQYVEPRFIYRTTGYQDVNSTLKRLSCGFTPNDSLYLEQWHLTKIHAAEAWNLEQGDSSIVIGIVDTGVDYWHPDLAANIAVNYADPINGIDDDGNGFVDDYVGWDLYHEDNDPTPFQPHGTAVAGITAAVSNNGIGLASPGFKCRVLPVKCSSDNPNDTNIRFGGEGIVYAADRGCRVINCSWGGLKANAFMDDVIWYATFEKNALVVAAAHNYNSDVLIYPASSDYVMSVAATDADDVREPYSNFNHWVDISAPSNIWVTVPNGGYENGWIGTSFSSPQVAGVAGLLATHDPNLSALQLAERIRISSDNIEVQNPSYPEQLGFGRLNALKVLSDPFLPAVRFERAVFFDGNDNLFRSGDTIRISGEFVNYLAGTNDLSVLASTPSPYVEWITPSFQIGALSTYDTISNATAPFMLVIKPGAPSEFEIPIRFGYSDQGYTDWQWLQIAVYPARIDLDNGRIATTLNSTGRMGFIDFWGDGYGVFSKTKPAQISGALGFMCGNTNTLVSDAAMNTWGASGIVFANDFKIIDPIHADALSTADFEISCTYSDSAVAPPIWRMGLEIHQHIYAWQNDPYFISTYEITNKSNKTYDSFRLGLWGDLEVWPSNANRAEQNTNLKLGYMYNPLTENAFVGIQLLGELPFNLYVGDYSPTYGGVNFNDSYTNQEKYTTMTESRPDGGFEDADGSNLSMVVGSGPYQLGPGATVRASFAILVADSLSELKAAALQAQLRFADLSVGTKTPLAISESKLALSPNPSTDAFTVYLEPGTVWDLEVFDMNGRLFYRGQSMESQTIVTKDWPSGTYTVRANAGERTSIGKWVKE